MPDIDPTLTTRGGPAKSNAGAGASDNRIVAERTGICRREDWIIAAP